MREFVREEAMSASVARQEVHGPVADFTADDGVRRRTERGLDRVFVRVGKRIDLVEAAASNAANGRFHDVEKRVKKRREESGKRDRGAERGRLLIVILILIVISHFQSCVPLAFGGRQGLRL